MNNLRFYDQFRCVPDEAQKTIAAGKLKGFTDINPMWRIKSLTEAFGPCGEGWYTDKVEYTVVEQAGEAAVICTLNLFILLDDKWSMPIFGVGGSKLAGKGVGEGINDEAHKMAYTDALSIACKNLGMAADIYFAKDRTKYNSYQESAPSVAVQARRQAKASAPKAPATYTPLPDQVYWGIIKAFAEGKPTKTGGNYRSEWITNTHAGKQEIEKFDYDVQVWINAQTTAKELVQQ